MKIITIDRFFAIWLIVFPFVTFGLVASDLSPFIAFPLFYFTLVHKSKVDKTYIVFLITILLIMVFEMLSKKPDIAALKLISSLLVFYLCFHNRTIFIKVINDNFLFLVSLIWLISGIITQFDPTFFSVFLFRIGSDESRGVTGMSPEPAYYGMVAVGILLLTSCYLKFDNNNNYKLKISIFFLIISIYLSKSVFAYLIAFFTFYLTNKLTIKSILLFLFIILFSVIFIDESSRLYIIVSSFIEDSNYIQGDISGLSRINSFFSAFDVGLLQNIIGTFYNNGEISNTSGLLANNYAVDVNSLENPANFGGLTFLVLRYGIFGFLLFIYLILHFFIIFIKYNFGIHKLASILIITILLIIGPMSIPSVVIGLSIMLLISKK